MKQAYTEVPGTPGGPPRQAAMRLLRYATALAGDPAAPPANRFAMTVSKLPAMTGPAGYEAFFLGGNNRQRLRGVK